jgi:hypothetical protein
VGGRTRRSLRRALELGDGWIPFGLSAPELSALLGDPRPVRGALDARDGFDVLLWPPSRPSIRWVTPKAAAATVRAYVELGATGLSLRFRHRSRAHYLEQLAAMAEVKPASVPELSR